MLQQDLRTLWGDILVLAWEGVRWLITWCHLIWEEWKKHEHRWRGESCLGLGKVVQEPRAPEEGLSIGTVPRGTLLSNPRIGLVGGHSGHAALGVTSHSPLCLKGHPEQAGGRRAGAGDSCWPFGGPARCKK